MDSQSNPLERIVGRHTLYTAVFEFDGEPPRVGASDTWLGGRLVSVSFEDAPARMERLENAVADHVEDLRRCAAMLRNVKGFEPTGAEIERAADELAELLT